MRNTNTTNAVINAGTAVSIPLRGKGYEKRLYQLLILLWAGWSVSIPLRGKGYEKHISSNIDLLERKMPAQVSIPLRGKGYEKLQSRLLSI